MGVRGIERSLEQWELGVRDLQRRMLLAPTPRERERWYCQGRRKYVVHRCDDLDRGDVMLRSRLYFLP